MAFFKFLDIVEWILNVFIEKKRTHSMQILTKISKKFNWLRKNNNLIIQYVAAILSSTSRKLSLKQISQISQTYSISTFSRFLASSDAIIQKALWQTATERIKKILKNGCKHLLPGCKYKVAILIDATLHERSSAKLDNAQKFNHGACFVSGHQWTTILCLIGNTKLSVPLPPIPFYTKAKCKEMHIPYKTEHERIIDWIQQIDLNSLFPGVLPSEIVFLMDRGYDVKKLQRTILNMGCNFVIAIKSSRCTINSEKNFICSVVNMFKRTRKIGPKEIISIKSNDGKKCLIQSARALVLYLKGLTKMVKVISVEKNKKNRFFASSNENLTSDVILRLYRLRWNVELYHRDLKSYLGMEDLGLAEFSAIHSHVNLVALSYIIGKEIVPENLQKGGMSKIRNYFIHERENAIFSKIAHIASRFNPCEQVKTYCFQEKQRNVAA